MQYRFTDLVDLPGFQQVMQSWYSVSGVATALLDMDRNCLCAVGWQDLCTRFHHLPPQAGNRCPNSDSELFDIREGDYAEHQCAHGLMNCAMPVTVNGEHIAILFMGQFLHASPNESAIRQQAQALQVDEAAYLKAIRQVPVIAEPRLKAMMTVQTQLAEMLATMGWEQKQLLDASATVNADRLRTQQHIALMLNTAQWASSTLDPAQVLERVAGALMAAVSVPSCGIYLLDAKRGVLVPRVIQGLFSDADRVRLQECNLDPAANPLLSEALESQSPAILYNAASDPGISQEMAQAWNIKSMLAVPIRVGTKMLGLALLITPSDTRQFTLDEIDLVGGIANAVALAVENARLYAEMRQRRSESQGLQRVAAALLRKVSPEEVLEIVGSEAQRLTGATASAVLLVDDADWLRVAYSSEQGPAFFDRIPIERSLAGIAVHQNAPYLSNELASESYEYLGGRRPSTFLSVPLHANGDVIGVLEMINKPGGFVPDDVRIVNLFANQAAINIEHARLNQQAGQLAVLEERQRLARELHDSVVQSLYSMALYADAATLALAAGKQDVTVNHLQELKDTARSAMYDMRLLIFELHPPTLEQDGLVTALRVRLASVEARAGVQAELTVEGERRLPIEIEQELYRITQEALNNIMKHAQAQHVTLDLRFTPGSVYLQVRDDGTGFDLNRAQATRGMGLHSFAARAAKIGGHVTVVSQPGQGTTVTVTVALHNEETQ